MDLSEAKLVYGVIMDLADQHKRLGRTADEMLADLNWAVRREVAKMLLGAGKIRHTGGIFRKSYAWT